MSPLGMIHDVRKAGLEGAIVLHAVPHTEVHFGCTALWRDVWEHARRDERVTVAIA